jgi:ankyrin repeat protein
MKCGSFSASIPTRFARWTGYGQSALHIAAATSDRREIIAMMIEAGFDIDQLTDGGETPLALAACSGHPENADILLFAGAKLDCGPQGPPPDEMKEMLDDLLGGLDDLMKEFSQVTEDT